jgi:squalene-hopene/tetraprenyl-beta-curcumene cyclase
MALRPKAKNPRGVEIRELFQTPPLLVTDWLSHADRSFWGVVFAQLDRVLRRAEPYFPKHARQKAIAAAVAFVDERLNGEDGLGAIYPAMSNALVMYHELGYAKDHPNVVTAKQAIRKLLVLDGDRAYCQPCLSPVWDTSLAAHALLEAGGEAAETSVQRGLDWLVERQVLDVRGDWSLERPDIRPGGWPFQYANAHYPDLDDTAVVVMALDRADRERYRPAIERATEWVVGMQSRNGGWGAFDADNTYYYLNHIPFADHGALLDPPTADVTGRCLGMLAQLGFDERHAGISGGLAFLRSEQEADGSWFGRWGTNYIYGTWSVLTSYNAAGVDPATPEVQRAVEFLVTHQRADGGWGEDGASYYDDQPAGEGKESTPSQTAWALLALMAAGEVRSPAVTRGIRYLVETQQGEGLWDEALYTAVGFPRVFYLRYHGYRAFFPLWALARYRNLLESNTTRPIHGL